MGFADLLAGLDPRALEERILSASEMDVERALRRDDLDERDLAALLSPAAASRLDLMARRSALLTRRRFGRVMQLYAPLYVSNECVNRCAYCGFAHGLDVGRTTLEIEEIRREAEVIRGHGFGHLLLVSGEVPGRVTVERLCAAVSALRGRFDSLSIETGTFDREGYAQLARAGVDGIAIYQETYLEDAYRTFHLGGPKRRFAARLAAIEDAAEAGLRALGVGALLGLSPWRADAYLLALHARYLTRRFWRSRVGVSFPRIRASAGGFQPPCPVSDAELGQMICAMRLFLPDTELVLSTREPAALRDRLIHAGITRMSAGSKTNPGGYGGSASAGGSQFEVEDDRPPEEVAGALRVAGFEPVWKDFDRGFTEGMA